MSTRLESQLNLIIEIDKLKSVLRKSKVKSAEGRAENSAEHSWQVALMALILAEHADFEVDIARVVKMLLIHDVVEIDAGDVLVYDIAARKAQEEKEQQAAKRIFGLLPEDQALQFEALWHEFEAAESNDAKFAKALDRLAPIMLNYHNEGKSWQENGVRKEQVLSINERIGYASDSLWQYTKELIENVAFKGWLQ
ncbi:HD domain-containing protein [Vibrio sp.]|nr:HD domain-containing protein [Vibrio sp.]